MTKENNIHIKIELCKDEISGELKIMTYFDPDAPNFCKDDEGYFWCPTIEERNFLNEAFEFIPTQNQIKSHLLEKKEEKFVAPRPVEPKPQVTVEYKKPWEKLSPFEKKDGKKPDQPPLEKKEVEAVFEVTGKEPASEEPKSKDIKEEDGTIAKATDEAIERALKKDAEDDDKIIKEVDEQTIIEKVLSQKKKGSKWGRNR